MSPSLDQIRARFPALADGFAFLENAGGSQLPDVVIDAMARFLVDSYVQTGAGYRHADQATDTYARARDFSHRFVCAGGEAMTVIGPSTSALLKMLAIAIAPRIRPGDEIVVSVANHEANVGPWLWLERFGARVVWWGVNPETGASDLGEFAQLVNERTRWVAVPHTSNLLGNVEDIAAVARLARSFGARTVVDGVAYAPHRRVDFAALGVDFYVLSCYKVFGPHMAVMTGRREVWEVLEGPGHFFQPPSTPARFELGCASYEAAAGWLALESYLTFLSGDDSTDDPIAHAFEVIERLEAPLHRRLVDFLTDRPQFRLVGPQSAGAERVPTVSFVHRDLSSSEVVAQVHTHPIGIRHGHMYAYRLVEALGIDPTEGVVRVSAVHTNTPDEIDRLLDVLDRLA